MPVFSVYLAMVIAAFGLFAVTLLATSVWARSGKRKPPGA
jgi:hypothetical protein